MSVDLLSRLPLFMQRYDELVRLTDSQNPEFVLLWSAEAQARLNVFIYTAGEEGLRRFENMLGITPVPSDSIESRRNRILIQMNNNQPFTLRFLKNLLDSMTNGNFEIHTDFNNYAMEIILTDVDRSIFNDLRLLRSNIIPANLVVTIFMRESWYLDGTYNLDGVRHLGEVSIYSGQI